MKIAVISYATKNREWLYSITNPVKRAYCKKHGYDFSFSTENLFPDRHPAWGKLPIIRKAIDNYDWVMWIDDDAMFANHAISLESIIEKYGANGVDIIVAKDMTDLNSGVMLFRNTDFVRCFIDEWTSNDIYEKFKTSSVWEQSAFNYMVKKDSVKSHIGVTKMRDFNSFLGGTRSDVKKGIHAYENGDFIVHASGIVSQTYMDTEDRRAFIVKALTEIKEKIPNLSCNSEKINIIMRLNDSIMEVNGSRTLGGKKDVIRKCFSSVVESARRYGEENCFFHIITDGVSKSTIEFIRSHSLSHLELHESDGHGNKESFISCLNVASGLSGILFFLEDDYLMEPSCLEEMIEFRGRFSNTSHICLSPCDCPFKYSIEEEKYLKKTVLLGERRHWSQAFASTCTFMIDDFIYARMKEIYKKHAELFLTQKDRSMNYVSMVYRFFPLFVPLKSLAEHYQTAETLSPYYTKGLTSVNVMYDSNMIIKEKVIVSFTSTPRRIENVPYVVSSMASQTVVPDKVVLYLHEDDFAGKLIPDEVKKLESTYNWFEIRWAEKNLKVHLKIIPALQDFPNDVIINIDDDMVYDEMFIQKLIECYHANPNCVCCHFCHGVKFENGNFVVVTNDMWAGPDDKSVFNRLFTGHGALYPPHIFDGTDVFDSDTMLSVANTHDEIWLWSQLFIKGVETVRVGFYRRRQHCKKVFDQSFGLSRTVNTASADMQMMKNATEYIRRKIDLDVLMKSLEIKAEQTTKSIKASSSLVIEKHDPLATLKGWKPSGYGHF